MRLPSTQRFLAVVLILGPALIPTASAQDAMQLDTAFKDSLLRKSTSEGQAIYPESQRQDVGEAHANIRVVRRHPKPRPR